MEKLATLSPQSRTVRDGDVLARCLTLDLELVKRDAMSKLGWSFHQTEEITSLYRRFLYLCFKHRGQIVPSEKLDQFWEMHILDTMAYRRDCDETLGFFLHHNPHVMERNAAWTVADFTDRFENTERLFLTEFGIDLGDAMGKCPECIPDYDPPNDPPPPPDR